MFRIITKEKLTRMLNAAHHTGYLLGLRRGWETGRRLANQRLAVVGKLPSTKVRAEVEEILSRWGF